MNSLKTLMAPEGPALCSQKEQENKGSHVGCCTLGCPDISILQTGIRHKDCPSGAMKYTCIDGATKRRPLRGHTVREVHFPRTAMIWD
jgi:hypothetical protein